MTGYVYYTILPEEIPANLCATLLSALPAKIAEPIKRYAHEEDRLLRIAGKLLLQRALKEAGLAEVDWWSRYEVTSTHQPVLRGSDWRFSISHSNRLAACVIAQSMQVGIDTEKNQPRAVSSMQLYFDPANWEEVRNAADPQECFYHYWTFKEAALKAAGHGIPETDLAGVHIKEGNIHLDDHVFHSKYLNLDSGYITCVATDQPVDVHTYYIKAAHLLVT